MKGIHFFPSKNVSLLVHCGIKCALEMQRKRIKCNIFFFQFYHLASVTSIQKKFILISDFFLKIYQNYQIVMKSYSKAKKNCIANSAKPFKTYLNMATKYFKIYLIVTKFSFITFVLIFVQKKVCCICVFGN